MTRMFLQLAEIRENSGASAPSLCMEMAAVLRSAEKQHILTMVARELTTGTGVDVVVVVLGMCAVCRNVPQVSGRSGLFLGRDCLGFLLEDQVGNKRWQQNTL